MSRLPVDRPVASLKPDGLGWSDDGGRPIAVGTVGESLSGFSRLGRRRLAGLRQELSPRELAVLEDIGRFRLLTSRQLERLHYTAATTPLTAARSCRRALRGLLELGLLQRLARRVGGLHAGSAAFVYSLSEAGQRLLDAGVGQPRKRLHEPSLPFVCHTLAIADLYVAVVEACRAGHCELLRAETEPACWRRWSRLDGSAVVLRPDLFISVGVRDDELHWFVELDRATAHLPSILRKCQAYDAYYRSGHEQQRTELFPRVVWVVPDALRQRQLQGGIQRQPGLTAELFVVTTSEQAPQRLLQ